MIPTPSLVILGLPLMKNVVIYTKAWCSYCIHAKHLLSRKGVSFKKVEISADPSLREEMVELAGGRTTVPQIFIGEAHVGGCDDLYALEADGLLDAMLLEAAAGEPRAVASIDAPV